MNKITDKLKRLIGRNSFSDLCSSSYKAEKTDKKTVVWYGGRLSLNGMTTSLCNLIRGLGSDEYRHIVLVLESDAEGLKEKQELFAGDAVMLCPFNSVRPSFVELIARVIYYFLPKKNTFILKRFEAMYQRAAEEIEALYAPDALIQFTGYDRDVIGAFAMAGCKHIIFAHNDKTAETVTQKAEDEVFLRHFLPRYDIVAVVTADIAGSVSRLGVAENRIHIVNNPHDDEKVKRMAEEEIHFDPQTVSTHSEEELNAILGSGRDCFITIGRFVPQKGHDLLLKAFARYQKEKPDTNLILIGGYGPLYDKTKALAVELGIPDKVVIIRQMKNPMPVLKRCQLFILSSLYEGQGLVLLEAASLGIPFFATDVNGPRGFVNACGGVLVEPNEDGIYQGMRRFGEGKIPPVQIDFEAYNKSCLKAMRSCLEKEIKA